jgi:Arc/MetJ-type ribon-helix-helix transcriptional regulator
MPTITVKVENSLKDKIGEEGKKLGLNSSDVVREALELWFEKKSAKALPSLVPTREVSIGRFPSEDLEDSATEGLFPRRVIAKSMYTTLFQYAPDAFAGAVEAGLHLQVLLLDKGSKHLEERAEDLNLTVAQMEARIDKSIKDVRALFEMNREMGGKGSVELRFYDSLPYFPFYVIDDALYTGYYVKRKTASSTHYVRFNSLNNPYAADVMYEFNLLWASAKVFDLSSITC